jgi:hypothetical protein
MTLYKLLAKDISDTKKASLIRLERLLLCVEYDYFTILNF